MYLLKISPISNIPLDEELSYFSAKNFNIGDIVEIPIRNKKYAGLVLSSREVENVKQEIRNSSFKTNKISSTKKLSSVPRALFKTAQECSQFYKIGIGKLLHSITPNFYFDEINKIPLQEYPQASNLVNERFAIQSNLNSRINAIKNLTREAFAKNESVHLIVPSSSLTISFAEVLAQGIENSVYILNSEITKATQKKIWHKILSTTSPALIISTPVFFSVPKNNVRSIVIENESKTFTQIASPFLSFKKVIDVYAKNTISRIYFSDICLSAATHSEIKENKITKSHTFENRLEISSDLKVIDTKINGGELSNETLSLIDTSKKVFLLSARKGFSPISVCGDCGEIYKCSTCSNTLALKTIDGARRFYCRFCAKDTSAKVTCSNCGSWKLYGYGMGAEKYHKILSERYPKREVLRIDSDSTPAPKEAYSVANKFSSTDDAILVGTTMALGYLKDTDVAILPALDAFLSIPEYTTEEKVFRDISELRDKTKDVVVIESRLPDSEFLNFQRNSKFNSFMESQLKLRQQLKYPPFVNLIKIYKPNSRKVPKVSLNSIKDKLGEFSVEVLIRSGARNAKYLIAKVPEENWNKNEFSAIITSIRAEYIIEINPEKVL